MIRPVKRPTEIRGALATAKADEAEQSASQLLREEREREKQEMDDKYGLSESEQ